MKLAFTAISLRLLAPLPYPIDAWYRSGADPVDDIDLGLGADLGVYKLRTGVLTVSPTVDGYYRYWNGFVPLRSLVMEVGVDVGERWDTCMVATNPQIVCFTYELGLGPHVSEMWMAGGEPQGGLMLGTHTGIGFVFGKGPVRVNTGLRLALGFGVATYTGGTTIEDQSVRWTYTIGGLRGTWTSGIEFR